MPMLTSGRRHRPGIVVKMDNLETGMSVMRMELDRPSVVSGAHSFGTAIIFLNLLLRHADNNSNSSSSDIFDVNTDVTPLTHCGARND